MYPHICLQTIPELYNNDGRKKEMKKKKSKQEFEPQINNKFKR